MTDADHTFGIAGLGHFLPELRQTALELGPEVGLTVDQLAELGLNRRVIPEDDDQPVTMAVDAAEMALVEAGLSPDEIDLVLWTGEEYKDYIAQTASIRLQEEVGCSNAWAFDLVGQGTTSILGLRIARDMMIADPDINTVLLAGGTRNIDLVDPHNPDTRWMLPMSASGGAIVLKRNWPENRLVDVVIRTDPTMADMIYVPGGGTEIPFAKDNLGTELMCYRVNDPPAVADYLESEFPARLAKVVEAATAGARPDYLALRHLNPAQRAEVLGRLGLEPAKSAPMYMWGHHGTNDPIMSLMLGQSGGYYGAGDLVCLASAGIGFTYAAASIRWGG